MQKDMIAEFDLNVDKVIQKATEAKNALSILTQQKKALAKDDNASTEAIVKNEVALKKVRTEYNAYTKALQINLNNKGRSIELDQKLNIVLSKEAKSIDEVKKQSKELREIRDKLDLTTQNGVKANQKINKQLDENNTFIKENVSVLEKQKISIGNYKEQMLDAYKEIQKNKQGLEKQKEALKELRNEQEKGSEQWNFYNTQLTQTNTQINVLITDLKGVNEEMDHSNVLGDVLSGNFKGLAEGAKDAGGAGNLLKGGLKSASSGMLSLIKASLAFIATPIGAILSVLVGAFLLVKNAMNRSEESTQKITRVFSVFGGLLNKVLKALEPLGSFLIDGLVRGFEFAGKAAEKAMGLISDGLSFIGFDDAAKSVDEFSKSMKEGVKQSQALADAEAKLAKSEREAEKTKLDYQKRAEKLRQIRDDESKTITERQRANEELGSVLKQQLAEEQKIAELSLNVVKARIEAEGKTTDLLDLKAEALTRISDIQERITGQESEQLTNRNSLIRDGIAKQKEQQQKVIDLQQKKLQLYILQNDKEKSSLAEKIKLAEEVYKKELVIIDKKAKAGASSIDTETEQENARLKLLEARATATIENANKELELYVLNNEFKFDKDVKLNADLLSEQEKFLQEKQRLQLQALESESLSVAEYEAKKAEITRSTESEIQASKKQFREQQKEVENTEKQAELELKTVEGENNFLAEFDVKQERLNISKQQELEHAEKIGADTTSIKQKYKGLEEKLESDKMNAKLDIASSTFDNLSNILGKETAAGKAAAIASTTISTYQSATESYKSLAGIPIVGPALGGVAAAAAVVSGLANVKKITSTKAPKAEHGISSVTLGGNSHAQGGNTLFDQYGNKVVEAESKETVWAITNRKTSGFINRMGGVLPALSYLNREYGGGIALDHNVNYADAGGLVSTGLKGTTQKVNLVENETPVQKLKVINVVQETIGLYNKVSKVENSSVY